MHETEFENFDYIPLMNVNYFPPFRNSQMKLGEVYFWTNTIKDWNHLLESDEFKLIIIKQLQWLIEHQKIAVYAYVIMPNHLHLIWELLDINGKEKPNASFNKWTSSQFLRTLRYQNQDRLIDFVEMTTERNHRFWQRDPLAIVMDSTQKMEQKSNYIHLNPLQEQWNLVKEPELYRWSSAGFYDTGSDEFNILTHYKERF